MGINELRISQTYQNTLDAHSLLDCEPGKHYDKVSDAVQTARLLRFGFRSRFSPRAYTGNPYEAERDNPFIREIKGIEASTSDVTILRGLRDVKVNIDSLIRLQKIPECDTESGLDIFFEIHERHLSVLEGLEEAYAAASETKNNPTRQKIEKLYNDIIAVFELYTDNTGIYTCNVFGSSVVLNHGYFQAVGLTMLPIVSGDHIGLNVALATAASPGTVHYHPGIGNPNDMVEIHWALGSEYTRGVHVNQDEEGKIHAVQIQDSDFMKIGPGRIHGVYSNGESRLGFVTAGGKVWQDYFDVVPYTDDENDKWRNTRNRKLSDVGAYDLGAIVESLRGTDGNKLIFEDPQTFRARAIGVRESYTARSEVNETLVVAWEGEGTLRIGTHSKELVRGDATIIPASMDFSFSSCDDLVFYQINSSSTKKGNS